MTEAIFLTLCNNHSSIFQPRLISGKASVRTIYSWASVISSLRFRLWLEQLISLISDVTSTISHSISSSHQHRATPASPEWEELRGGSKGKLGFSSVEIWASTALSPAGNPQRFKPREEGEELKREKLEIRGINLDCRLGFWRVSNIGLESGEKKQ